MTIYDNTYWEARAARIEAEAGADAVRYELAAAMFERIDMHAAAARCRERAQYYRAHPAYDEPRGIPVAVVVKVS